MDKLETKRMTLELKALVADSGTLEGYAAVTGNVDLGGDVILRGAFVNLQDFITKGFAAFGHDWYDEPIGFIESAVEDEVGLRVVMRFHSTQDAQDARTVVKERIDAGKFVGLSIGYRVIEAGWETRDGQDVRVLKAIEVFEFSIVTMPMNPEAQVTSAKSLPNSESPPAGKTLDEEADTVLAAVDGLITRIEEVKTLRESDGRGLSEKRVSTIDGLLVRLEAMKQKPASEPVLDKKRLAIALAKGKAVLVNQ